MGNEESFRVRKCKTVINCRISLYSRKLKISTKRLRNPRNKGYKMKMHYTETNRFLYIHIKITDLTISIKICIQILIVKIYELKIKIT